MRIQQKLTTALLLSDYASWVILDYRNRCYLPRNAKSFLYCTVPYSQDPNNTSSSESKTQNIEMAATDNDKTTDSNTTSSLSPVKQPPAITPATVSTESDPSTPVQNGPSATSTEIGESR